MDHEALIYSVRKYFWILFVNMDLLWCDQLQKLYANMDNHAYEFSLK